MANGHVASDRMLSKIRNRECGHEYAERQLVAAGAPARMNGEEGRVWIERLKADGFMRSQRHPGNWIYNFALTRTARRAASELQIVPHPKRDPTVTMGDVSRLEIFASLAA